MQLTLLTVLACGNNDKNNDSSSAICTDVFYADADADGYGDGAQTTTACSIPSGYAATSDDCDDTNPAVHPGAEEVCDGIDNDCDDSVDAGAVDALTWYADTDADGFGDDLAVNQQCAQPSGSVDLAGDCDDTDPSVNPSADEICDDVDNDCDELVDALDPTLVDGTTWYADVDADGYGDPTSGAYVCTPPKGSIENDTDCNDADEAIHPDATESCDEIDNDCDGFTDDDDTDAPVVGASSFFADSDGDGLGDAGASVTACVQAKGYVDNEDDCDDTTTKIGEAVDYYDDGDGDGYGAGPAHATCTPDSNDVLVDGDCGVGDAEISPGAPEVCNGVDDNCDGLEDGDDPLLTDGIIYLRDADGDGYGDDSATVSACSAVSGYVTTGGDCDDGDAAAYPSAIEYCDAIDNDCNSSVDDDVVYFDWYADADGDGYGDDNDVKNDCVQPSGYALLEGGDCDDSASATNPGATEVCDDGVDNDCDGRACTKLDLSLADAKLVGEEPGDYAGCSVSGAGDVDGDGHHDLLVGASYNGEGGAYAGAAYLLLGPVTGNLDLALADAKLVGEADYDIAGRSVSGAGDVDGDGHDDLLVGATGNDEGGSYAGAAYLVLGPVTGTLDLSAADAKLVGEDASDEAGASWTGGGVSGSGDVDDDGHDDLLVGARGNDEGSPGRGTDAGAAYLVLGPVTGTLDLSLADAKLGGEGYGDEAGAYVSGAGDIDGDGHDDLLISAPGHYNGAGGYLVLGPVTGTLDLGLADAKLTGDLVWNLSSAGDVDGDGRDDVLVGAPEAGSGIAYLVLGPITGTFDLGFADAKLVGAAWNDGAGSSVSGAGDVDGDGHVDLLIGALYSSAGAAYSGAAHVVLGPVTGTLDLSLADATLVGEEADDNAGWSVSGPGDVDGDGRDDLLVGADGNDEGGSSAGAAYLVYGGSLF